MIKLIHESWKPLFLNTIDKGLFRDIDIFEEGSFYPSKDNIFRVFRMPVNHIKVVILGQDPYPKGQATGLAFAVDKGFNMPASLRNIQKEVGHDIDQTLTFWVDQGVFLLNIALTVEEGKASSHISFWHEFTKKIIKHISEVNPCIWMLWGNYAKDYKKYIKDHVFEHFKLEELHKNLILEAAHPAAESYKSGAGFFGCNHFNKANIGLAFKDKETINW